MIWFLYKPYLVKLNGLIKPKQLKRPGRKVKKQSNWIITNLTIIMFLFAVFFALDGLDDLLSKLPYANIFFIIILPFLPLTVCYKYIFQNHIHEKYNAKQTCPNCGIYAMTSSEVKSIFGQRMLRGRKQNQSWCKQCR